jgi:hypothetical protein
MNKRLLAVSLFVGGAALARLLPHSPNVTPIAAMALFGGAYLANRKLALALPLVAMLLSDLVLGYTIYGKALLFSQPVVYLCMLAIVAIGGSIRARKSWWNIIVASLGSSVMFYIVTNLAVWAFESLYPKNWIGLMTCYTAAIPFFRNSVAGDLFFAVILFGGFALLEKSVVSVREPKPLYS